MFSFTTFKVGILCNTTYRDGKPIGTFCGYGATVRAVDGAHGLDFGWDYCLSGEEEANPI